MACGISVPPVGPVIYRHSRQKLTMSSDVSGVLVAESLPSSAFKLESNLSWAASHIIIERVRLVL